MRDTLFTCIWFGMISSSTRRVSAHEWISSALCRILRECLERFYVSLGNFIKGGFCTKYPRKTKYNKKELIDYCQLAQWKVTPTTNSNMLHISLPMLNLTQTFVYATKLYDVCIYKLMVYFGFIDISIGSNCFTEFCKVFQNETYLLLLLSNAIIFLSMK